MMSMTTRYRRGGLSTIRYPSQIGRANFSTSTSSIFPRRRFVPRCSTGEEGLPNRYRYSYILNNQNRNAIRSFTHSAALSKKTDAKARDLSNPKSDGASVDVSDMSQLQTGIMDALKRLKDDLTKLRVRGRLNTEVIENLRVHISKDPEESLRLGELAQVIPKGGRVLAILVGEENLVKPTHSAILASDLSLTPQRDPNNPLQLNIQFPPPTKESRDQTVKTAKVATDRASVAVRNSRSVVHKRLQEMQKKKLARPDDIRKAHDQMEKVAEKGQKEVKELFETAKKVLEQG